MSNVNDFKLLYHNCCCKQRDEYFELYKKIKATGDTGGKDPIRLDLSGTTESKKQQKSNNKQFVCECKFNTELETSSSYETSLDR